MSKPVKSMLFWIIVFPFLMITIFIVTDYFKGTFVEITYYLPYFLWVTAFGLIAGFVAYNFRKIDEDV
ncbi:hypothetical protein [Alkalibacillus haloalkaliphilus]|uniref:hypothetical protein n=1 Tax=Alkalibacillus haloalkaliphilus TaxID=94136 RepID=UPI002936B363|nr:hypothetical protein [Alkalibacillus haloalkaliphilus]MDV2580905.1 hypothetical protein [Alkalibacillus haloalkaliphilus]